MRFSAAARYVLDLCTQDQAPLFDVFAVIHARHGGTEAECPSQSRLLVEGFLSDDLAAVYKRCLRRINRTRARRFAGFRSHGGRRDGAG